LRIDRQAAYGCGLSALRRKRLKNATISPHSTFQNRYRFRWREAVRRLVPAARDARFVKMTNTAGGAWVSERRQNLESRAKNRALHSPLTRVFGAASPATKRARRVISGAERYTLTRTLTFILSLSRARGRNLSQVTQSSLVAPAVLLIERLNGNGGLQPIERWMKRGAPPGKPFTSFG
jgi:hypothetical protein